MKRKVRVKTKQKSAVGEIVYQNEFFVVIRFHHYRECFLQADIQNGEVFLEKLD